jgi:hypothetical protein
MKTLEPKLEAVADDVSSANSSERFPKMSTTAITPDHWIRRTAIMTLMAGVATYFAGYDIADMDETLGHQITVTGVWLAITGSASWFITHLILKGSAKKCAV